VVSAIEHSCNSYFRMLTAEMTAADVAPVAQSLGLQTPEPGASGIALAGIGDHWQISPLSMARAYVELARRREQPGIRQIVYGMEESAERGTGAEIDRALGRADAVVKTGTAPCTHSRHGVGDGFVIALVPAADPQILLMVRVHGVPGALAARTAGQMLRDIEE
jgi:cell division protein FtsI/penicillin-binding protein 2